MKRKILLLAVIIIGIIIPTYPQLFYKNKGESQTVGSVSNGKLVNGYKFPYKGNGFRNFSVFDYYILGRCYVHSDIYKIVLDSYNDISDEYPAYTFRIMECSKRKGGRPFPHRTHQNGTSIDFMTPLTKKGQDYKFLDKIGIWRYAVKFDEDGKLSYNKKVEIDFDKMARHILILEKHARKNGYRIKKVILETNLKDEIFQSKYGKALQASGIYFVRNLSPKINELHDDHYHIDFEKI